MGSGFPGHRSIHQNIDYDKLLSKAHAFPAKLEVSYISRNYYFLQEARDEGGYFVGGHPGSVLPATGPPLPARGPQDAPLAP